MYVKYYFKKALLSNKVEPNYDLIHYEIYKVVSHALKQNYLLQVSYIILPNSLKDKCWPVTWEKQQYKGYIIPPFVLKYLLIIFSTFCFFLGDSLSFRELSISLQGAMHLGQIFAGISQWLSSIPRWRETLPSSSCSGKIWNKVTERSKYKLTCAKKSTLPPFISHLQKLPLKQSALVRQY